MKIISILTLIMFMPLSVYSIDVNLYQASEKNSSVLEIVDNCGKYYRLLVKNEDLGTSKTINWFEMIINRKDFCGDVD